MKAEIRFILRQELTDDDFLSSLKAIPISGVKDKLIAKADLSDSFKQRVIHWQEETGYMFLVFRLDKTSYKIHVENIVAKDETKNLKKNVEEVVDTFMRNVHQFHPHIKNQVPFINLYKVGLKDAQITIMCQSPVFYGKKQSWIARIWKSILENKFSELYVPVVTLLMSYLWLGQQYNSITLMEKFTIPFFAWVLFIFVKGTFLIKKFDYEEA